MSRWKKIIFDADGTLVDTKEGLLDSVEYAFEMLGMEKAPREQLLSFIGPPLSTSFPAYGIPGEKVDEAIRQFRVMYYEKEAMYRCSLFDGIKELLERLKEDGYEVYVGTSKPEPVVKKILETLGIADCFEYIAGASFDRSRETKEAVLSYLKEQMGGVEDAVMIGDTKYDAIGAGKLGIPCIGVTWGYEPIESMEREGIIGSAEDTEELYRMLTQ